MDTPGGSFPAVTKILHATKPLSPGLERWKATASREQLLDAEAKRDRGARRGTLLHREIDGAFAVGVLRKPSPWAQSLSEEIARALEGRVLGSEVKVWHEDGYAGVLDLVYETDRGIELTEWKTWEINADSKHTTKPREWCDDWLLQARAYAKAYGRRNHVTVDRLRVVIARCIAKPDGLYPLPAQVFTVERNRAEYGQLWTEFSARLALYQVQQACARSG